MPQVAVEPEPVAVSVAVHNHLDTASATVLFRSMVLPQLLNIALALWCVDWLTDLTVRLLAAGICSCCAATWVTRLCLG